MYVRRVQSRPFYQTTTFLIFEPEFGNISVPLIVQPKHLPQQPQHTTASLVFVTILSTVCGLTTVLSLLTMCIWCRKKNTVFPMNKCEMPAYYGSSTTMTEGDDISQTTEVIDNFESCLSTVRKGIPKRPVTFLLRNASAVSYYKSLDKGERQNLSDVADDLAAIDFNIIANPYAQEIYSPMSELSLPIQPQDATRENETTSLSCLSAE